MIASKRLIRILPTIAALLLLTACAQQPKMLYSWDSYQPEVYNYLKGGGEDYSTQIIALEKNIETARSDGKLLPPGFHAHLGMLYLKSGQEDRGIEQLLSEKAEFPESSQYMDFLLQLSKQTTAGVDEQAKQAIPLGIATEAAKGSI